MKEMNILGVCIFTFILFLIVSLFRYLVWPFKDHHEILVTSCEPKVPVTSSLRTLSGGVIDLSKAYDVSMAP
jgi:hypothetical protein